MGPAKPQKAVEFTTAEPLREATPLSQVLLVSSLIEEMRWSETEEKTLKKAMESSSEKLKTSDCKLERACVNQVLASLALGLSHATNVQKTAPKRFKP